MQNSTLTFSNLDSDYSLWFQAYCLNPPNDSCDFGPCPNLDVTGIGQQISVYTSSTILASVVVMYSPADVEKTTYPYLVTIYAFPISALISFLNSNLTQNDALFVLVAVASPVTLYLWITSFFPRISPWAPIAGTNRISQRFLFIAVLGSLVVWLTMVGIIVGSPSGVSFSQQRCKEDYGQSAFLTMIWPSHFLLQMLWLIIGLNFAIPGLPKYLGLAIDRTVLIHGTVERNLLQWTRDSLILPTIVKIYQIVSFILFTLQVFLIAPFSNTNWYYFIAGLGTVGTVLLFVLLDYGYRRYQHRQDANSLPPYSVKGGPSIDAKKLVFICMAVILFGEFLFVPSFPTILYALRTIMLVAVLALVWWINAPRIYHSKQQVLWSRFLEIWPFHYQSDHILGDGHDQYWCHFDWLL